MTAPPPIRSILVPSYLTYQNRDLLSFLDANFYMTYYVSTSGTSERTNFYGKSFQSGILYSPGQDISLVPTSYRNLVWHTPVQTKKHTIAGKEYLTQIPSSWLDKITDIVDLDLHVDSLSFSPDPTLNLAAATNVLIGENASISFLDPEAPFAKQIAASIIGKNLKTIKISKIFKGSAPSHVCVKEQTAKQILSGSRFFLYSFELDIIDCQTACGAAPTTHRVRWLALGIFEPLERYLKFRKATQFICDLTNDCNNNNLFFIDSQTLEDVAKTEGKFYSTFWTGALKILDGNALKLEAIDHDVIARQFTVPPNTKAFSALQIVSTVQTSEEGKRYQRALSALTNAQAEQEALKQNLTLSKETISLNEQNIQFKVAEIDFLNTIIKNLEETMNSLTQQIKANEQKIETHNTTIKVFDTQTVVEKNKLQEKIKETLETQETETQRLLTNMRKSGCFITEVIASDQKGNTVDLSASPRDLIDRNNWYISKITFLTTRPNKIYVDKYTGTTTDIVYGGPYEVTILTAPNGEVKMSLRLASASSVFGLGPPIGSTVQVKIHPHSQTLNIKKNYQDFKNMVTSTHSVCLGDAESILRSGAKEKDIKKLIAGAMAWLTSCCSKDDWGQYYTWFPHEDQINTTADLYDLAAEPALEEAIPTIEDLCTSITAKDIQ